jgi:hypothetical protein
MALELFAARRCSHRDERVALVDALVVQAHERAARIAAVAPRVEVACGHALRQYVADGLARHVCALVDLWCVTADHQTCAGPLALTTAGPPKD